MKKESILKDFLLTVATLGFYNIYVQIRQIIDVNTLNSNDRYSFTRVFLFSLLTLGLYFCYHEYSLTVELNEKLTGKRQQGKLLWVIPATFLGIWPAVDSYQQILLNRIAEGKSKISDQDLLHLIIVGGLYFTLIMAMIYSGATLGEIFL